MSEANKGGGVLPHGRAVVAIFINWFVLGIHEFFFGRPHAGERLVGVDRAAMIDNLHGWFMRYNFCRKNWRIGGKTPYEAYLAWFAKQTVLFIKEPAALLAFRS